MPVVPIQTACLYSKGQLFSMNWKQSECWQKKIIMKKKSLFLFLTAQNQQAKLPTYHLVTVLTDDQNQTKRLKRGSSIVRLSSALESWGHRSWQRVCGYVSFLKVPFPTRFGLSYMQTDCGVTKNRALEKPPPSRVKTYRKLSCTVGMSLFVERHLLFWRLCLQRNSG